MKHYSIVLGEDNYTSLISLLEKIDRESSLFFEHGEVVTKLLSEYQEYYYDDKEDDEEEPLNILSQNKGSQEPEYMLNETLNVVLPYYDGINVEIHNDPWILEADSKYKPTARVKLLADMHFINGILYTDAGPYMSKGFVYHMSGKVYKYDMKCNSLRPLKINGENSRFVWKFSYYISYHIKKKLLLFNTNSKIEDGWYESLHEIESEEVGCKKFLTKHGYVLKLIDGQFEFDYTLLPNGNKCVNYWRKDTK